MLTKSKDEMFINAEKYLPQELLDNCMYMGTDDGKDLYKHYWTRRYICIDDSGKFYGYNSIDCKYVKTSKDKAINYFIN